MSMIKKQQRSKTKLRKLEDKLIELTSNDKSFDISRSYLLGLASKAQNIFESSQPEKKNKILKMLLANCEINQKRLQLHLLKPFEALLNATKTSSWLTIAVTDSITGVKCYKWDSSCDHCPLSVRDVL